MDVTKVFEWSDDDWCEINFGLVMLIERLGDSGDAIQLARAGAERHGELDKWQEISDQFDEQVKKMSSLITRWAEIHDAVHDTPGHVQVILTNEEGKSEALKTWENIESTPPKRQRIRDRAMQRHRRNDENPPKHERETEHQPRHDHAGSDLPPRGKNIIYDNAHSPCGHPECGA